MNYEFFSLFPQLSLTTYRLSPIINHHYLYLFLQSRLSVMGLKIMKGIITLLFIFFVVKASAQQQYVVAKLFDMAATADKIIYGKIVQVEEHYFFLQAANNPDKGKKFKVRKSILQAGAYRWDQYKTGQYVLLFLRKGNDAYRIMSLGGEGELAIVKDSVVLPMQCFTPATNQKLAGPKGINVEYRNRNNYKVGSKEIFGMKLPLNYFYRSVIDFRDCYQVILKKANTEASTDCFNFFERYPKSKSDVFKRRSYLMRLMYQDMETAQINNCLK